MEKIDLEIFNRISWPDILWSIILIVIAFVIWNLVSRFRNKLLSKVEGKSEEAVKRKAAISSGSNFIKLVLIVFTVLNILQINGINVSSILAGLGIAGAVVALAVQDMGKDIIQGLRILADGFFSVGQCIRYNGEDYQVISFSIRTTTLKSIVNNNVVIVSNRNISEVTKLSGKEFLYISLPYETDPKIADEVFTKCAEEIGKIKGITKSSYLGLRDFEESAIKYQLTFTCKPIERYNMIRASMRIIKDILAENKISIPYNKITILQ